MKVAATFLVGAKSRLLPASIPFRFFAAAAIFHVLMWLSLFGDAEAMVGFRGGLGPVLAAVHLLTLGIMTSTAIGAAAQLLPVATRRAIGAVWLIKLVFWLTVPGIIALIIGMYLAWLAVLISAAVVVSAGLLLFGGLLADNLRRAGNLPIVAACGWAAIAALALLAGLGLALAIDYDTGFLWDHSAVTLAHVILGGFGFMGMLVLGFSHILVPMFALSAAPARRPAFAGLGLAAAAVMLGTVGALTDAVWILSVAAIIGLAAAAVHLWLMQNALATGMRKRLGLSFVLIRAAWIMLPTTLLVGLAVLHGFGGPNGPTLFGFLLIGGWLLTFLLGILQRILPFLASMHTNVSATGTPPLLSELTKSGTLQTHAICHGVALAVLAVAIMMDSASLVRVGASVGLVGALSFSWFTASAIRRILPL